MDSWTVARNELEGNSRSSVSIAVTTAFTSSGISLTSIALQRLGKHCRVSSLGSINSLFLVTILAVDQFRCSELHQPFRLVDQLSDSTHGN